MSKELTRPVPVFMYHSVGIVNKKWLWNHLTCPYDIFEDQLKTLNRKGYKSIDLTQLYDYIFNSKPIPTKSIVFTFDDGYLDNWVFAYPLMKKYGFNGIIYVNPEFVDKNGGKRIRFDQTNDVTDLETVGFLSWDEMREMEKEGVMTIESHALTHTWYPISDKIIDFRHPGDKYIWMTWNNNSDLKYKLQIDDENLIEFGEPVYEHEKSLSSKRFFPDERMKNQLCNFVKQGGDKAFFNNENWKNQLTAEAEKYRSNNVLNERYETEEEYHDRILYELRSAKSIIESELNKEVWFHCWPGGSATVKGMEISNSLGFKLSNTANDIKEIRYKIKNNNQFRINRINRLSPIAFWDSKSYPTYSKGRILVLQINIFTSTGLKKLFLRVIMRIYKYLLKIMH